MTDSITGGKTMKQEYEKPALIVYEDLSDVTMGIFVSGDTM
jgi:hypothetical protein